MPYLQIDNVIVNLDDIGKIIFQNIHDNLLTLRIFFRNSEHSFIVNKVRYNEIEEVFSSLLETDQWKIFDNVFYRN
jgi:hypothetical protein